MANPVSGVSSTQQAAPVSQAYQTPKQNGANKAGGATEDTVTISSAGSAASQPKAPTQNQKGGADADHDGK
jgi:hypothetical protein